MKVSINKGSRKELESLPGIGPALAQRIIVYRRNKRFKDIYELSNVPLLGHKRMTKLLKSRRITI